MRSVPGLLSVFLIAAGVACAELPPDLPPASPLPFAPGPVIGGTIKGNPAAGIVPVKDLIEANRKDEYIPMAEPIPGETGSSAPLAESIPNAEPIPGETNLHAPVQPAEASLAIPSTAFSPVPVPQHETRVAILGYHDFSRTLPATEMRMNTDVFRSQMQALKASGVPVISMKEFLEWKLGDRQLPAKCVMITIDDGWKSVYTDAYPILKETGFPFTIFPYTKFITGRGSAMSPAQIQEMLNNGATLGSHSVSHLYPRSWRAAQRKGTQAVLDLATAEIGNSRKILQEKFPGSSVEAYCYPGGFILPEMISKAEEAGFQAAFTVIPKKVTKDTDRWRIHRYMVFGKDPKTFTRALNFNVPSTPETPATTPGNSSGKKLNSYPAPAHLSGRQYRGEKPDSRYIHFPGRGTLLGTQANGNARLRLRPGKRPVRRQGKNFEMDSLPSPAAQPRNRPGPLEKSCCQHVANGHLAIRHRGTGNALHSPEHSQIAIFPQGFFTTSLRMPNRRLVSGPPQFPSVPDTFPSKKRGEMEGTSGSRFPSWKAL